MWGFKSSCELLMNSCKIRYLMHTKSRFVSQVCILSSGGDWISQVRRYMGLRIALLVSWTWGKVVHLEDFFACCCCQRKTSGFFGALCAEILIPWCDSVLKPHVPAVGALSLRRSNATLKAGTGWVNRTEALGRLRIEDIHAWPQELGVHHGSCLDCPSHCTRKRAGSLRGPPKTDLYIRPTFLRQRLVAFLIFVSCHNYKMRGDTSLCGWPSIHSWQIGISHCSFHFLE